MRQHVNRSHLIRELIDTLWNVNFLSVMLQGSFLQELIDTLWNVNMGNVEKERNIIRIV